MASLKDRALAVGNRLGVKVIPRLPDTAKRLMSGGKAVCIDGNTLDPTAQMLLAARRAAGLDGLIVGDDAVVSRANFDALIKDLDDRDVRVAETRAVAIPGPAGVIPARHYRPPAGGEPAPLVVFFHGGGWVVGGLDSYDAACRLICRDAGVHVLAIDYRLAPEHRAPDAVDDAHAAYRWASEHAAELGADPRRVAVAVRQGNLLATSFHPELTDDSRWHALFAEAVREARGTKKKGGEASTDANAAAAAAAASSPAGAAACKLLGRKVNLPADLPVLAPGQKY